MYLSNYANFGRNRDDTINSGNKSSPALIHVFHDDCVINLKKTMDKNLLAV